MKGKKKKETLWFLHRNSEKKTEFARHICPAIDILSSFCVVKNPHKQIDK